jgi:integrase
LTCTKLAPSCAYMKIKYTHKPSKPSTPHEVSYWIPQKRDGLGGVTAGKQKRYYRKTKREALDLMAELDNKLKTEGQSAVLTLPDDRRKAEAFDNLLAELPEDIRSPSQLAAAVREWVSGVYKAVRPMYMIEAADQFLTYKASSVSDGFYRSRLKPMAKLLTTHFDGDFVNEVTAVELRELLDGLMDGYAPETIDNRICDMRSFFGYAAKNGLARTNVALEVDRTFVRDETPRFFTVEEVEKLFATCIKDDPELLGSLALTFFGFVRPEELYKMVVNYPQDIRPLDREVYVRKEVAKGRLGKKMARMISGDIKLPLWDWVTPDAPLTMTHFVPRRRAICKKAQLDWFNSAGRHCYMTYACQLESPSRVADWAGHTTEKTAKEHYRGVVSKSSAEDYAKLTPARVARSFDLELPSWLR